MISCCAVLLLLLGFAQGEGKPPDFNTLQKLSLEELRLKTQANVESWGLDRISRWDLDQDTGELAFSFADGTKAVAPAQIIGTYNSEDHTWLWAWDNPSVEDSLKKDALKVRKYGEEHHVGRLTKSKWVGTEEEAWAMTALAVKLCGEQGAYRGPAGGTKVFIAFGPVTLSKR
ncbi:MAG: hypothetical protein JOZ96_28065 [Acidobacteria bacterium]|nr:hypothetical protein [Acidobacteriota bacterium]